MISEACGELTDIENVSELAIEPERGKKMEMEFVDDLTGQKVWGEVLYDEDEVFGGHSSWGEVVMCFGGWYLKPSIDLGKQDLWKASNSRFENKLFELVDRGVFEIEQVWPESKQ